MTYGFNKVSSTPLYTNNESITCNIIYIVAIATALSIYNPLYNLQA